MLQRRSQRGLRLFACGYLHPCHWTECLNPTSRVRYFWGVSSCSESFNLPVRLAGNTTSRQMSFKERFSVGSRFSELLFLDLPRTATEQAWTYGFRRNSSSSDKAPEMCDSFWLNSRKSYLVTLSSLSSEIRVMYSSAIPGLSVFCDWLFLVFSGVSLETAPNLFLFLIVAIILRELLVSCEVLIGFLFFQRIDDVLCYEWEGFNKMQRVKDGKLEYNTRKATTYIKINVLSFSYLYLFLGGKHKCLHANSRYK